MWTNIAELHTRRSWLVKQIDAEVTAELERSDDSVRDHVRRNPQGYKHRTKNLIRKTRSRVVRMSGGRHLVITNTAPYAPALEGGSGLHGPKHRKYLIEPRRRKFLRFIGRNGVVFRRSVMHPGVKPTRFLSNAWRAEYAALGPRFDRRLGRLARKF